MSDSTARSLPPAPERDADPSGDVLTVALPAGAVRFVMLSVEDAAVVRFEPDRFDRMTPIGFVDVDVDGLVTRCAGWEQLPAAVRSALLDRVRRHVERDIRGSSAELDPFRLRLRPWGRL